MQLLGGRSSTCCAWHMMRLPCGCPRMMSSTPHWTTASNAVTRASSRVYSTSQTVARGCATWLRHCAHCQLRAGLQHAASAVSHVPCCTALVLRAGGLGERGFTCQLQHSDAPLWQSAPTSAADRHPAPPGARPRQGSDSAPSRPQPPSASNPGSGMAAVNVCMDGSCSAAPPPSRLVERRRSPSLPARRTCRVRRNLRRGSAGGHLHAGRTC